MKKVKVDDLIGNKLDWAVAMAKGREGQAQLILNRPMSHNYRPSTDGAVGVTIMDSEISFVEKKGAGHYCAGIRRDDMRNGGWNHSYGETILIAAMRCFVKSKFGDVIQIPKELA